MQSLNSITLYLASFELAITPQNHIYISLGHGAFNPYRAEELRCAFSFPVGLAAWV